MNGNAIERKYAIILGCLTLVNAACAQETGGASYVRECAEKAWNTSWGRFYKPETHLFYDYLSSYEIGKELAHLPSADEVKRQFPNNCGYGTGQEDGMISAGVMIDLIVDRYAVTKEENLRACAYEVFKGIQLCTFGHGATGFVARAVCHEDLKSIYISSSRDQYTHAVHGLWRYFKSPLPDADTKKAIGVLLSAIADRMTRNVIPENGYDSLRADGTRDDRGISTMWKVQGHEAARLPMIYAAAWDVTGNPAYYELYRKYLATAVEQSLEFERQSKPATYALLQMQCSLELLEQVETNGELKQKIQQAMALVAARCEERARHATRLSKTLDLSMTGPDWRISGGLVGEYRRVWYCIRESGEALSAQLMDTHRDFSAEQQLLLIQCLTQLNYDKVSSCGIFYLQSAYWKALRRGYFKVP